MTVSIDKPISITESTFSNRANATLYVPKGSKGAYEAADYWKEFKEIVEMADPSAIIDFADANVKAICVANWDTNKDGEMSEDEAAEVTDLGEVFKENTKITSFKELQYFTSLSSIGGFAFWYCKNLTSATIPSGVTSIGECAFANCNGLTSVTIPSSVTSFGRSAFANCSGLTSVTIPSSMPSIDNWAFYGCSGLTSVTIPSSVASIGNSAFNGCSGLTSIEIPSSVRIINTNAFRDCSSLTSLTMREGVTSIGNSAFRGCSSLTSVTIPSSVKSISTSVFYGCSGLTSVTIPSSVTSIGNSAFGDCSRLTSVTISIDKPISITESTFSNRANATLYVPKGSRAAYDAADYWKEFKEIVELEPEPIGFDVTDVTALENAIYIEPVSARVGGNVEVAIKLKNAQAATAYTFDLVLPEGVTIAKDNNGWYIDALSDRHSDHSRTLNYIDNSYSFATLSGNSEALTGNDGAIRLVTLHVADDVAEGTYPIEIKNASYSLTDGKLQSMMNTMTSITAENYILGDVNGNNMVDIGDAVSIVNYLVGKPSATFIEKAADTNKNNQVDIGDAVTIVNFLVGKTASLSRSMRATMDEKEPQ